MKNPQIKVAKNQAHDVQWHLAAGVIHCREPSGRTFTVSQHALQRRAVELVRQQPDGVRFMQLARSLWQEHTGLPLSGIVAALKSLGRSAHHHEVVRPEHGLLMAAELVDRVGELSVAEPSTFYPPLAEYLACELEEVAAAVPLGQGRGSWQVPDILGVSRPRAGEALSWTPELVAMAVRFDSEDIASGFGSALGYQVFATKVYLALPASICPRDRRDLTLRCRHLGVGLILLGREPHDPCELVVPAQRTTPDVEATRHFVERLRGSNEEVFRALFV